ncbi:ABC transporter ATP-binding protein [Natrialba taiwanensis]|uniref:ABC transporter n=1 Tax=Natrialba taiwanensis DSM 12281 TaxID=1230458 RepID=L9ZNT7_9EURY|nr:ABC transporter ATP-binding protein [Natrialba taiwanensis]ELY87222.1 ABC transporter [Natrialba taiwanensis DSM 12281]
MAAIETNGVSKRFDETHAVRDVDLTVESGEVFGFLGPNGAGKSTTINMLLDFVRPTTGAISILGVDPQEQPRVVRRRTGVLPEGYAFYDRLSGRRHVELAIDMYESDDDPIAILDRVGLTGDEDTAVGTYSKGMRQRLALGIALVDDPDLLILDEPSSGLDPNGIRTLREIVREEADQGTTVFLSSHVLDQVEAVCDRVAIMNDGTLLTVDTVDGLRETLDPNSTLILSVDTVPESVSQRLAELDRVDAVDVDAASTGRDGTISITCTDSGVKSAAIGRVEDAGATVTDIGVEDSSLEELFAAYTDSSSDGERR